MLLAAEEHFFVRFVKNNMKRPVVQKDEYGCSVACMAFLLDKNYDELLNLIPDGKNKVIENGLICKEITDVLNNFGSFEYKYIKPNLKDEILKGETIVFIKRSKEYPSGHFLIRYKNEWMDPWINLLRNKDIKKAKTGFRKELPGTPIYLIRKK